jgi:glucuronoarabinoxylan endo-1,4-beta-xylanase
VGNSRFLKTILAGALFTFGCSSTTGQGGTGGASNTGGSGNGTGGTPSSGGTNGTGGSTGGSNGTGGSNNTGGVVGTGGSSGGSSGKGGMAGGSATGGMAGGSATGGMAGGSATGGNGGASSGAVTVQLGQTEQTIQGFGINDNWGQQFSSSVADSLFTTTSGIGLTILRTGMSDGGAFYNTFESSNMSALKSRAGTDAKVIGSVWSPPGSCKSGQTPLDSQNPVNNGGHVMSSCFDSWSTTIANFAGSNGFYAMSIGNEPDFASCGNSDPCNGNYPTTLFTASEMTTWVKMAGPKLKAKNVKVIAPEASEWIHTWSNVSAGPDVGGHDSSDPLKCGCFPDKNPTSCASSCSSGGGYDYGHVLAADATAWGAIDILGVHEYDSQVAYPWPSDVNGGKPNKEIWQTEMSGVKWWPEQGPSCDINNGVAVAGWIHSALVDGQASAWLWWWYQAYNTDDNEGLLLKSGTSNSSCGSTNPTKRFYTLGNYSKFIRPGYKRVDISGTAPSGVLLSAYAGSDGTVVIVAINKNTSAVSVPISIAGGTAPASLTPNVTSSSDNLKAGTAVTVSGGSFTAMLGATTVTTFVGK